MLVFYYIINIQIESSPLSDEIKCIYLQNKKGKGLLRTINLIPNYFSALS